MAIGAFIPLALFVVILGSVGVRLTLLWRRTRQVPEMSLGLGLVVVSLAMPLSAVGRAPATAMEPLGRVCFAGGLTVSVVGLSLITFFNYWVFRRDETWAKVLYGVICALLAGSVLYMSGLNFAGDSVEEIKSAMRPGALGMVVAVLVAFAWAAVESLGYWAASRRRLALGLADPVVSNRFLLWGIASATSCVLMAVVIGCVAAGMIIMREPLPLTAMAASGVVMSASWYLTFLAPAGYQRFVRRRAGLLPD